LHNKILFIIVLVFTSIINYKKVYIFNTLTNFFYIGNFCYSFYNVKLFNPNFKDPTFRYCNGGAYGTFYSKYLNRLKKKFHFIDIGANIGIYSLIASKNNNCIKIDAFEPNPTIYNKLKKNLSHVNYATCNEVAITNKFGDIEFFINPDSSGSSQIDNPKSNLKIKAVNGNFLKKIIAKDHITNIKIDVEGHELVVLNEIIKTVDLKKINSIYIEIANDKTVLNNYIKKLKKFKLIYFQSSKKRCDCLFENSLI
tara:strand:+ start:250 stop:1011 length:762 start_codon:yes stop_codon:yes gene_type:complete